jgi:hypothetical protein
MSPIPSRQVRIHFLKVQADTYAGAAGRNLDICLIKANRAKSVETGSSASAAERCTT